MSTTSPIAPEGIVGLSEFREWTHSPEFPERGRIDFIQGRIEADMSPDDLFTHNTPKAKLSAILMSVVEEDDRGYVFLDRARVVSPAASLSAEPDLVFVSFEAIEQRRVVFVPRRMRKPDPDRLLEIEGGPDLVVEVVSDKSKVKDTRRLPRAYFAAGVKEYWLVDARRSLRFTIQRRGRRGFVPVVADSEGFQISRVLERRFRFHRERDRFNMWKYGLDVEPFD